MLFRSGESIRQPALFIGGTEDGVIKGFGAKAVEQLATTVPGLKGVLLIEGGGHWIQQEHGQEVNTKLIEFLRSL